MLTTTVSLGLAFNYAHDELLWTKQHWDEYKLHFPYSLFRTDEPEVARAKASMEGVFAHTSLEGPQLNLQQLIEDDLKR